MLILILGTAIFVMRRRFSVWRLNGSKQNLNAGGATDGGESGTSGSVAGDEKVVVVVTPSDENPNDQITSVENTNAVVNAAAATEDEAVKETTEVEPKTVVETTDGKLYYDLILLNYDFKLLFFYHRCQQRDE